MKTLGIKLLGITELTLEIIQFKIYDNSKYKVTCNYFLEFEIILIENSGNIVT